MKTNPTIISCLLALVAVSCKVDQQTQVQSIPYVQEIIADSDNPAAVVLARSSKPEVSGDIVIVGSLEESMAYSHAFRDSDTHDNARGSEAPDGLPDFAGETVTSIVDHCASIAAELIDLGGAERLRELAVRQAVSAIDTVYHLSPYDLEGLGHKSPAKLVVMTSPYYSSYGKSDVDTLLSVMSCRVPVVCPFDIAASKVVSSVRKGTSIVVGIVCDSLEISHAALQERFLAAAAAAGISGAECHMFRQHDGNAPLAAVLDQYIASDGPRPLDALIVCDPALTSASFAAEVQSMTSVMSPESITYGKYLSKGFKILSLVEETTAYCYNLLRERNLFTLDISYPQSLSFVTVDNPDDEKAILVVPPTYYVQD